MRTLPFTLLSRTRVFGASLPYLSWISFRNRSSNATMPPVPERDAKQFLKKSLETSAIIVFSKSTCPFCHQIKKLLSDQKINHAVVEVNLRGDGPDIQEALTEVTGVKTVPQMFVRGKYLGGCVEVAKLHTDGRLMDEIKTNQYDYDLVVIGGGSGGLAASKEACLLGAKVAVLDFVEATPQGTTWGLGGTCVNVGCIPKKLMHQAALLRYSLTDSPSFGWAFKPEDVKHNWDKMIEEVQNHIHSLNWGYKVQLRDKGIAYLNAMGELVDPHTVKTTDKQGNVKMITAKTIILATGERPRYPDIPGDRKYGITSDDLFSLPYNPGKTLVVGASYVSLECAGFLNSFGIDVTVMVRSIFLRGFDQQMADKVADYMGKHGTKFVRSCVPTAIEEIVPVDKVNCKAGRYRVKGKYNDGKEYSEEFNTVVFAIGRDPCTSKINLKGVGVELDKVGRVNCKDDESTTVSNIYAIGDIVSGKPQLTPVAIHAGKHLARRLYAAAKELTDYVNVATTVFTPLEYGSCGLSEEDAIQLYGEKNIEVYHSFFKPLEWTVAHREDNTCYAKLVCNKNDNERVLGLHVLGPNAGEITQGYAVAIKMGATKTNFDGTIGIHPTCSEVFTTLHVTKRSGDTAEVTGC